MYLNTLSNLLNRTVEPDEAGGTGNVYWRHAGYDQI